MIINDWFQRQMFRCFTFFINVKANSNPRPRSAQSECTHAHTHLETQFEIAEQS